MFLGEYDKTPKYTIKINWKFSLKLENKKKKKRKKWKELVTLTKKKNLQVNNWWAHGGNTNFGRLEMQLSIRVQFAWLELCWNGAKLGLSNKTYVFFELNGKVRHFWKIMKASFTYEIAINLKFSPTLFHKTNSFNILHIFFLTKFKFWILLKENRSSCHSDQQILNLVLDCH